MVRSCLVAILALLLCACTPSADTKAAEESVVAFHNALNAGQYDTTYASAEPEFKAAITQDEWVKLLTANHTKLGAFRSGKTVTWIDNASTSGHYITLQREAAFDHGAAQEEFVFKMKGEKAALVGYHITSNALIPS
jgi:hypothetical protein